MKKKIQSHYKMKGMGKFFHSNSQIGGSLEDEVQEKQKEIKNLETQLLSIKNEEQKQKIKQAINNLQSQVSNIKNRMKALLYNVAQKSKEAAMNLSSGIKSLYKKSPTLPPVTFQTSNIKTPKSIPQPITITPKSIPPQITITPAPPPQPKPIAVASKTSVSSMSDSYIQEVRKTAKKLGDTTYLKRLDEKQKEKCGFGSCQRRL
jgi:hypothetical protein